QEADGVFGTAIDFGMALLAPVTLHLGHGQALDADRGERLAHLVQLEWLDDCHHDFHQVSPFADAGFPRSRRRASARRTGKGDSSSVPVSGAFAQMPERKALSPARTVVARPAAQSACIRIMQSGLYDYFLGFVRRRISPSCAVLAMSRPSRP